MMQKSDREYVEVISAKINVLNSNLKEIPEETSIFDGY